MKPRKDNVRPLTSAFTLVELLVVVAILGMLMSISIPGYKKLRRKDPLSLGAQQLMDELEWARIHAMSRGSDVCMVFFPLWSQVGATTANQQSYFQSSPTANALLGGQLASYAFFAEGSAGEQPGQLVVEQTFLTKWKQLPMGVVIPSGAFNLPALFPAICDAKLLRLSNDDANLPAADAISLPTIRFHGRGDLNPPHTANLVLSLQYYGTNLVYPSAGTLGDLRVSPVVPNPRRAQIEVSALTGRTKLLSIQP